MAEPVGVVEVLGEREAELDCCCVEEGDEDERRGKSPTPCMQCQLNVVKSTYSEGFHI